MPKLFLHTGLHKTGSTSIQKMLHDNRHALTQQGFLYPKTGLTEGNASWGHHELAYALRDRTRARPLWQALRDEADQAQLPNVIISSEELSLLPFPTLPGVQPYKLIAEIFEDYEIVVICYLRPQADMVDSLYNHHVKSVGETRDIIEFLAQASPRLDYIHYLHVAAVVLGDSAIRVCRYGPNWLRGDIIKDFAVEIGINLALGIKRPKVNLNPGLTTDGLAAMIEANIRLADDPARLKRERMRLLHRHKARPFESCNMLSPEARSTITALYRHKNVQIGRRFLKLDGDLFDLNARPRVQAVSG